MHLLGFECNSCFLFNCSESLDYFLDLSVLLGSAQSFMVIYFLINAKERLKLFAPVTARSKNVLLLNQFHSCSLVSEQQSNPKWHKFIKIFIAAELGRTFRVIYLFNEYIIQESLGFIKLVHDFFQSMSNLSPAFNITNHKIPLSFLPHTKIVN